VDRDEHGGGGGTHNDVVDGGNWVAAIVHA